MPKKVTPHYKNTYTLDQVDQIAADVAHILREQRAENTVVVFDGDLGAGKTTLIKALCRKLGVNDRVSSPTFSLVNTYEAIDGLIYHFDFYRINDEAEAYDIGFEEYLASSDVKLIEWPEKVANLLPSKPLRIELREISQHDRQIELFV